MKHGIDISKFQRNVDKDVLSNNAPDFIITRSSYVASATKTFTVDPRFEQNAPLLKGVALRGVYHYYSSEKDWQYQADHFINLIKDHHFDFFVVDMEGANNNPDRAYALGAVSFFKKAKQVLGIPGLIYTAKYYYQDHLRKHTTEYDNLPLWIASPQATPSMPVSRDPNDWEIWQYSASGDASKWGFEGNDAGHIDLNRMKDAFYESFDMPTATPTPVPTPLPTSEPIAEQYIQALNSHSPGQVAELYTPNAVHITPKRTIQGKTNISNWYLLFFNQLLPNATFQLTGYSGTGSSRHVTWTAQSSNGKIKNGNDTIGMIKDKIAYHFSHFTITDAVEPEYKVTAQSLNVRAEASSNGNVIGSLHKDDVVTLLEKSEDLYWFKIETSWDLVGWASHKFLVPVQDSEPPTNDPPWLKIAHQERGVKEFAGSADNPRIVEYHKSTNLSPSYANEDETPWCSSFVNWCMEKSNYEGTDSAWARSWLTWGKKLATPRRGCVVVFERPPSPTSGHVGFYIDETASHIRVLGGNQSNEVNISPQSKANFLCYRWPGVYHEE